MGLWDKIMGEFVDVIEWTDDSDDTMVYRFERYGNEIKYGAQLTVRESQAAVFVNEGEVADVFGPGRYELDTKNLPITSTMQAWAHGFESPFKAEVYFFNLRQFTDLKWGTKNAIMLRDREFGPVRLRAFGTYGVRIAEPSVFMSEIVGTDGHFTSGEVTNQLRNLIVSRFSAIIGGSNIPVLDLAASYDQLSDFISERIHPEYADYGLELTNLLVENISLPKTVEDALDRRTSMGVIGDLSRYSQFQAAEAMQAAAENPSGGAAEGIGLGVGMAMGQQMAKAMTNNPTADAGSATPPPLPTEAEFWASIDGEPTGPMSLAEMERRVRAGEVAAQSLVWSPGMAQWRAASEMAVLNPLFAATPPPLPE